MTDRRRINGPAGGTSAARYDADIIGDKGDPIQRLSRERKVQDIRKIFLKTQLTPSASGSAYLELEQGPNIDTPVLLSKTSSLKLTCTVHGPRPLPRSAAFSPHMLLTTHVKFAPFATRHRRGYLRDAVEKDLAAHLETALRGVVISDRWPKSSIEIIITILEGEETHSWGDELATSSGYGRNCNLHGMMSILSGCITVASAAIIDAGIDCVDVVSGGVAALVRKEDTDTDRGNKPGKPSSDYEVVVDPAPCEHRDVLAICAVGYLKSTEEIVEMWMNGSVGSAAQDQTAMDLLIDGAVEAASASALVVHEAIRLS